MEGTIVVTKFVKLPPSLEDREVLLGHAVLPSARRVKVVHHTTDHDGVRRASPILWAREKSPGVLTCICLLDTDGRTGRFELEKVFYDSLPEILVEW